jgi:hypothetical protein
VVEAKDHGGSRVAAPHREAVAAGGGHLQISVQAHGARGGRGRGDPGVADRGVGGDEIAPDHVRIVDQAGVGQQRLHERRVGRQIGRGGLDHQGADQSVPQVRQERLGEPGPARAVSLLRDRGRREEQIEVGRFQEAHLAHTGHERFAQVACEEIGRLLLHRIEQFTHI